MCVSWILDIVASGEFVLVVCDRQIFVLAGGESDSLVTAVASDGMVVILEDDVTFLEEVVVTGYMTEKKADLTGSVAVVKMKDVADVPTGNVMQALQGRVAGMNVTTDGTPGGGNTSTLVRGTTTINNSSPLYVIDGMPTRDNVGSIVASSDIESIQVLKDASPSGHCKDRDKLKRWAEICFNCFQIGFNETKMEVYASFFQRICRHPVEIVPVAFREIGSR